MKVKKVIVVHKKSNYQKFILEEKSYHYRRLIKKQHLSVKEWTRLHEEHVASLNLVETSLKQLGIPFQTYGRYHIKTPIHADLIITVGGDGTFLEAAHYARSQLMFGVNSTPKASIGHFSSATARTFCHKLQGILAGQAKYKTLQRLQAYVGQKKIGPPALNEILFTSRNAGATSRYWIYSATEKRQTSLEEQKSSGIWVATPAGSTAAIKSAGTKPVPMEKRLFLYRIRELYQETGRRYRHKEGTLSARASLKIIPKMDDAALFFDGAHVVEPLPRGETISFRLSANPLKIVA